MNRIIMGILGFAVVVGATGCQTTATQDGALLGGALGAGLGAVIGHQSGHQGEGALIGAGSGALIGAILGDQVERQERRDAHYHRQHRQQSQPQHNHPANDRVVRGHYETRIVESPTGEVYEERVWVPHTSTQ